MTLQHVALECLIKPAKLVRAGERALPILSMTMHKGLVDQANKFKKRVASTDTTDYKVVRRNQLVVGFPIDEGVLSFQDLYDEAIVSPAYDVWDLLTEDEVEYRYLERFLRSPRALTFYASKLRGTTARRRTLPDDIFLRLEVPLPPSLEQRRIAEVLDCAEALRAERRAALAQLNTLTQSIFLDMFGDPATNPKGYPTMPLASLIRDGDKINYGVVQPGNDLDDGVPLIRIGDLLDGRVSHAAIKRIAPVIEANYKRSRLRGDEILMSCVGSIGVVALADESVKGFNIARAVARIPLAESVSRMFIATYIKSDFAQRYFTNELRTVSQPTLNIKQLSETTVALPSFTLQREFDNRYAAVEDLKHTHHTALSELDALFDVLQHRAFRGEL